MHKDQGSENLGEAKAGLAADSLVQTEGDRDRHTANSGVEGWFGRLQRTMACNVIGAWMNNLDYDIATMSSRALHSSDLIKHQPSNKSQRLCGASPIQEQFHPQCYLDAPQHTYGELTFAFIKKDERPSKTGPRAFKAIYAGKCRKVKGNILVHPIAYDIKTGSWTILPSQSVCQYRIIAGCMPLLTTKDAIIKDYSG